MAALLLAISGCASRPPLPRVDQLQTVELEAVPFYPQRRYQCGPAALATVLGWSGLSVTPDALKDAVFIPGREGSLQPELRAQARRHGRLAYRLAPQADKLFAELAAGHPVLVLQNLALSWWPVWHYAVVVGFDAERGEVLLRSGTTRRHSVPLTTFMRTWQRAGSWALVALPPDRLPVTADPASFFSAAYDLERTGQPAAAAVAYRAGLERWPQQAELGLALANLHHVAGEIEPAAHVLQAVVAAGAEEAVVYNNLALLLANLGRWREAEAAARTAVDRGGAFAAEFQDTLERIRCRQARRCGT
jgi:predicted Zn-dependent protease